MFRKLLLAAFVVLLPIIAWAQNPDCPTRPINDNSNACASTAYVTNQIPASLPTTGAPIVLLFTGQSNFTNLQTFSWTPAPNLLFWNFNGSDGNVGTAYVTTPNTTIGGAPAIASQIAYQNPTRTVYAINISFSGQAISHWLPGTGAPDVFQNILNNISAALAAVPGSPTKIDGFIWWQGNTDGVNTSLTYVNDWETMYNRFRSALLSSVNWFPASTPVLLIGLPNSTQSGIAWYNNINSNLQVIETNNPDMRRFVDPNDVGTIGGPYWVDTDHMGGLGYFQLGQFAGREFPLGVGRRVDDLTLSKHSGLQVNGGMDVQQFNNSGALTSGVRTYIIDQWVAKFNRAATLAITSQTFSAAGAVFYPQSQNILRLTATTGLATLAAGDYVFVEHDIEGFRAATAGWGLPSSIPLTVSFWLTGGGAAGGNMTLAAQNSAANRTYLLNIPVFTGNNFYSVVIPGDLSGTWTYDNTTGIRLIFCFGAGSTFQGTNQVWQTGTFYGTSATTNAFAATNNLIQITGLSVVDTGGRPITPVQSNRMARAVTDEILFSQRYYRLNGAVLANMYANGTANVGIPFTAMRATPTASVITNGGCGAGCFANALHDPVGAANCNVTAVSALTGGTDGLNVQLTHSCAVSARIGELAPETIALDARLQ